MSIMVRGGGDLASGVAYRLFHAGLRILITEVPQPLAVRRLVSFSEAVYQGEVSVEGVIGTLVTDMEAVRDAWAAQKIPVFVDPQGDARLALKPQVLIDGRMTKQAPDLSQDAAPFVIGLGPGFIAGENCHCVIETKRGHTLGRVIWKGSPAKNTGSPESINGRGRERVLRAPITGKLVPHVSIGDRVHAGQIIAEINGAAVMAPFDGVLRGLLREGFSAREGLKIGDLDPRAAPDYCRMVSDKALAIGGGVLEAILARGDLRARLWV